MPLTRSVVAVLVVTGAASPLWAGEQPGLGERIYLERCGPCHGDRGRGDGPTAPALQPPPRDFGSPGFWQGKTSESLRAVVKGGKAGTMMPPFEGVLTDTEIDAVVEYIRRFDPAAAAAGT